MRYDGDATAPKCPSDEVLVELPGHLETIDSPILPDPVPGWYGSVEAALGSQLPRLEQR
jgi:hypothetical protein